jgi:hypothetical protein
MTVRDQLELRIAELPGVVRGLSRYGHGVAFRTGEREIAHFHGGQRLDVRLTRARIRELKSMGPLDPRVTTRGASAEWVEVKFGDESDLPLVLELIEEAVRANT